MSAKIHLDLYGIIYEKTNTGYSCHSEILIGCSSSGSTMKECRNNMKKAILLHLEGLEEDGIRVEIDSNGNVFWYNEEGFHRDGDLPAIIWSNETKEWYKNNKKHRDGNKPAVVYKNGAKEYWIDGVKEDNFAEDRNYNVYEIKVDGE